MTRSCVSNVLANCLPDETPDRRRWEITVDGKPRSYRVDRQIADPSWRNISSAKIQMVEVTVRDLEGVEGMVVIPPQPPQVANETLAEHSILEHFRSAPRDLLATLWQAEHAATEGYNGWTALRVTAIPRVLDRRCAALCRCAGVCRAVPRHPRPPA